VPGADERSGSAHERHRPAWRRRRAGVAVVRAGPAHAAPGDLRRRRMAGVASRDTMTHVVRTGQSEPSRRSILLKIGAGLTGLGTALTGVPIVGFVFSAFARPKRAQGWVSLGPVAQFPVQETRLAVYQNPSTRPWDGDTAHVPCWVRRIDERTFQVFAI